MLNADYNAISFTSERRALQIVMNEKAQMLEHSGRRFVSELLDLPRPSVIVLNKYQKLQYRKPIRNCKPSRHQIYARDNATCQYCGAKATTIDHIVPRCKGGGGSWTNLVASCMKCNQHKGDKDLANTSLQLRRPPKAPESPGWQQRKHFLAGRTVAPTWAKYLGESVAP